MSYTRGEKERRIMEKSGILKNKLFLYLTEFFCRNVRDGSRTGCEQAVGAVFQLVADRVDDHHRNDHDRNGAWKYLWRKSADRSPDPDKLYRRILIAAIWIALIPVVGKYIILGISALLIFTVSSNFLYCRICGMYGDFCIPTVLLGTVTPSLVKYSVDSLDDSGKTVGTLEHSTRSEALSEHLCRLL